jgi:UDPglucose 6-dehydrogenase
MTSVSVVGLGKLGACMAACIAARGHSVVGVDCNRSTIQLVNSGQPPVFEPSLAEKMREAGSRLSATEDYTHAILESEATFVVVPTPSEDHGGFSLQYVERAMLEIGRALRQKSGYHLVVLTSTVLPGSCEYSVLPLLEDAAGKRCGRDFGFCYHPEFIALGSVIRDFLNPDFVLIGEFDAPSGERLAALYHQVCENQPPIARLGLINAELAKVAVNTYVTMKITFANMLAALCEELPGGDVDEVVRAIGLDTRIGSRYLKGALGYGGPCFPRDNMALAYLARKVGQRALLAEATDQYNETIVHRLAERIAAEATEEPVAVLGLAYKPDTTVVEESQGLKLARRLAEKGLDVLVYDALALENARRELGDAVRYALSLEECVQQAGLLVVTNPDKEFAKLHTVESPLRPGQTVFDAWRLLRRQFGTNGEITYLPLGVGNRNEQLVTRLQNLWAKRLHTRA